MEKDKNPIYKENDLVEVEFYNGDILNCILGKARKLISESGLFLGWSYDSKTNGINWVAECFINKKL